LKARGGVNAEILLSTAIPQFRKRIHWQIHMCNIQLMLNNRQSTSLTFTESVTFMKQNT